tara:strand:+ start:560 stop:733 length:174 start_codon:yes stop_codon:yes gene_type:complete
MFSVVATGGALLLLLTIMIIMPLLPGSGALPRFVLCRGRSRAIRGRGSVCVVSTDLP